METKKEIRQRILLARDGMPQEERMKKSMAIMESIMSHPWFMETETIYSYVDFGSEVGTRTLITRALEKGKQVAVPKIQPGAKEPSMEFYYIRSLDELKEGFFHIQEPVPVNRADGKEGLAIMPGVAFDLRLSRIGYGKGYYDRYLRLHSNLNTMAAAFDLQCEERIPSKPHDIRPMLLVTEKGIFRRAGDIEKE